MRELRLRPFRSGDANEIIKWCSDELTFYKWTAGKMGEFPLSAEKLLEVTSGRKDNDKYFPFCAFDESGVVGFFTLRQPGIDPTELCFGFVIVSPSVRGKG